MLAVDANRAYAAGEWINWRLIDFNVPSMYCIFTKSTKSVSPKPALMLSVMLGVAAAIIDISNTAPSYGVTTAVAFCAPLREKIRVILVTDPTRSKPYRAVNTCTDTTNNQRFSLRSRRIV